MIISLVGVIVGLLACLIAWPERDERRFDIYMPLFALHLIMTTLYILYSLDRPNDSSLYYFDPWHYRNAQFQTGTVAVVQLVQSIKANFGGTFSSYFFLFQCLGMIGMAFLIRSADELSRIFDVKTTPWSYAAFFLPSLHFWSVAPGKDSLVFMAVCILVWASIRLKQRMVWVFVALLVMWAVRPHMAAIVLVCGVASLLLVRGTGTAVKLLMIPAGVVVIALVSQQASQQFRLDPLDTESVANFIESNQNFGDRYGGGADLKSLSYPLKVLSLLFRPLFIDAKNFLGIIASFENLLLLYVFGYLIKNWNTVRHIASHAYFASFGILYSLATILLLAAISYNIGLGQRQKMMALPPIIMIYLAVKFFKRRSSAALAGNVIA